MKCPPKKGIDMPTTSDTLYFPLLKKWCDALLALQIHEPAHPRLHGGILCPSCARVHGRCGDAILPLVTMTALTGEAKYLDAAKRLFDWSETMVRPDGSYNNDTNSAWNGITVFMAIQLGETLHHHAALLDAETLERWTRRFETASWYMLRHIDEMMTNVNYPITCTHLMALAWQVLGEEAFLVKAKSLAETAATFFTADGLVYGEGKPPRMVTPKGCRPVDLGYNVEESLPALAAYARITGDDEMLQKVLFSMRTHLDFMLPDGAWDNSWGTRMFKWTYWGSRTSDGCAAGYMLLSDLDPAFAEAAYRNVKLLDACTHDGLLHGGPMYDAVGEPPCVHHTFCHAKPIANLLLAGTLPGHACPLPSETAQGVKYYPTIDTVRLRKGGWHATITAQDFPYMTEAHPSGGAVTLLWHEKTGPVITGTMERYQLIEPNNMQLPWFNEVECLTPRLEAEKDGVLYRSSADFSAHMSFGDDGMTQTVEVVGHLRDKDQQPLCPFTLRYLLTEESFTIEAEVSAKGVYFQLPVVTRDGVQPHVDSPQGIAPLQDEKGRPRRVFGLIGGFEAVPYRVEVPGQAKITITV